MSLWQEDGTSQEGQEGPSWDVRDDWHEGMEIERGTAKQRLNMNHGFVRYIKTIQHDRDQYEQQCREQSMLRNAAPQVPEPQTLQGPAQAATWAGASSNGRTSAAQLWSPPVNGSDWTSQVYEESSGPERGEPTAPLRERKQAKVRLGFGAYQSPKVLAPESTPSSEPAPTPEAPAPKPVTPHPAAAGRAHTESRGAAGMFSYQDAIVQTQHASASSSPPPDMHLKQTTPNQAPPRAPAPLSAPPAVHAGPRAAAGAAALETPPQRAPAAARQAPADPPRAGPSGFAAAFGLEDKGVRTGRELPPRNCEGPAPAPTVTLSADRGRPARSTQAPAQEQPPAAARAGAGGGDEIARLSSQATAMLRSHLVAATQQRQAQAKVERAPRIVPYVAGPRAQAKARSPSPEAEAPPPAQPAREPREAARLYVAGPRAPVRARSPSPEAAAPAKVERAPRIVPYVAGARAQARVRSPSPEAEAPPPARPARVVREAIPLYVPGPRAQARARSPSPEAAAPPAGRPAREAREAARPALRAAEAPKPAGRGERAAGGERVVGGGLSAEDGGRAVGPGRAAGLERAAAGPAQKDPAGGRKAWAGAQRSRERIPSPESPVAAPEAESMSELESEGSWYTDSAESETIPGPSQGGGMRSGKLFERGEPAAEGGSGPPPAKPRQAKPAGRAAAEAGGDLEGSASTKKPEVVAAAAPAAAAVLPAELAPPPVLTERPKIDKSGFGLLLKLVRPKPVTPVARMDPPPGFALAPAAGGGVSRARGEGIGHEGGAKEQGISVNGTEGVGVAVGTEKGRVSKEVQVPVPESAIRMIALKGRQLGILAMIGDLESRVKGL